MSLRRLNRELVQGLRRTGRTDLAERALEGVRLTDDGGTVYVHAFARPDWPRRPAGAAYVLAHADYPDLTTCGQWREMLEEARLRLHEDLDRLIRWFDGH